LTSDLSKTRKVKRRKKRTRHRMGLISLGHLIHNHKFNRKYTNKIHGGFHKKLMSQTLNILISLAFQTMKTQQFKI